MHLLTCIDDYVSIPEKEISFRDALRAAPPPTAAGVACSMEEGAAGKETAPVAAIGRQEMPSAALMVRLILTVVGRKLSRNPNTYSSIIGLVWSLISFRLVINSLNPSRIIYLIVFSAKNHISDS